MRLPKRSASTSSRRCMVMGHKGPLPGRISFARAVKRTAPQQTAATLARPDTPEVRGGVVAGGPLERLVDQLLFAAQSHGDVAARLQVVVDLDRAEEHR